MPNPYDNNCPERDSNPQGFLHQILSLARLPIPPSGHGLTFGRGFRNLVQPEAHFLCINERQLEKVFSRVQDNDLLAAKVRAGLASRRFELDGAGHSFVARGQRRPAWRRTRRPISLTTASEDSSYDTCGASAPHRRSRAFVFLREDPQYPPRKLLILGTGSG